MSNDTDLALEEARAIRRSQVERKYRRRLFALGLVVALLQGVALWYVARDGGVSR